MIKIITPKNYTENPRALDPIFRLRKKSSMTF